MLTAGDEALRALERSIRESPRDVAALLRVVVERRRRGDLGGAYETLLRARAVLPRDEGVREALEGFPAWPGYRGGAGRTGASATRAPRRSPRVRWVNTSLEGAVHRSTQVAVAVSGSRVYVTLSREVYHREENGLAPARPLGRLHALDVDDGAIVWTRDLIGLPSAPVHAGPLVLVSIWRGHEAAGATLLALDACTGSERFAVHLPAKEEQPRPLVHVHPPLAVPGRALITTSPFLAARGRARLACVDTTRGELVWEQERARIEHEPAASDDAVYVRTVDPGTGALRLEALALEDGGLRYAVPTGGGGTLLVTSGRVVVLEEGEFPRDEDGEEAEFPRDRLVCRDAATGRHLWSRSSTTRGRFHPPVACGSSLVLPVEDLAGSLRLARLDLDTGELQGEAARAATNARISSADGVVVGSGGAVGLERDGLAPLWETPTLRADTELEEDLAVAHGRILGVTRSGVAFCFEESL